MTDPNTPAESTPQNEPAPAPKKRRLRKWLIALACVIAVILILILLAPTIISTPPVRAMVVSSINENLNGKLAINDWSIGWTSGVTLNGVKIEDEQGVRVIEIASIRVPISLIGAA